jgi:hypothetical protein
LVVEVRFYYGLWEVSQGRTEEEIQLLCWSYSLERAVLKSISFCEEVKESKKYSEILLVIYNEDDSVHFKGDFAKEDFCNPL